LIRSAEALEILEKVDTVVVDKTGTLTEGRPRVVSVVVAQNDADQNENDVIRFAASLERASEHPLATAVVQMAQERGLEIPKAAQFDSLPGKGVTGTVAGRSVIVGN